MDWYRKHSLRIVIKGAHIMADRENEKKYSAEAKGLSIRLDRNVRDSLSYKELWKKKISRNILIMD